MILVILILLGIAIPVVVLLIAFAWYTIVPADAADVAIRRGDLKTFSPHEEYNVTAKGKAAYFKVPNWIPGYGMTVHRMPLKVININVPDFLAFDVNRARFLCDIRAYVVIEDPVKSAKRFPRDFSQDIRRDRQHDGKAEMAELKEQVSKIVQATTRDATTKRTIIEIINDRQGIISEIKAPLSQALTIYGLKLEDIELVEFKDPTEKQYGEKAPPHVIADYSSIEEVKINSQARQKNAEEIKLAELKEATAEEEYRQRQIERDEKIAMREEKKNQEVAKQAKIAMEETLEVTKVEEVKTQKINKEKMLVEANQRKEIEAINREQKRIEGEGDKLKEIETATGIARKIMLEGKAAAEIIKAKLEGEADGKMKLQEALNLFSDDGIRAMAIIREIEKNENIGVATAQMLQLANVKAFLGGTKSDEDAWNAGKQIESLLSSNTPTGISLLNSMAQKNDLGFKKLDFEQLLAIVENEPALKKKLREAITNEKLRETKTKPDVPTKKSSGYISKDRVAPLYEQTQTLTSGVEKEIKRRRKELP